MPRPKGSAKKSSKRKRTRKQSPELQAKRRIQARNVALNRRIEEVPLKIRIKFGNDVYGPGIVRVRHDVAVRLRRKMQEIDASEDRFWGTRGGIIGPKSRTGQHKVLLTTPEKFKDPGWPNQFPEADKVSKTGE